jgi:hypothetical protein
MLANLNNMDQSMRTLNQDFRQISTTAYYMGHNMGRMSNGVNKISNPVRMFMPW